MSPGHTLSANDVSVTKGAKYEWYNYVNFTKRIEKATYQQKFLLTVSIEERTSQLRSVHVGKTCRPGSVNMHKYNGRSQYQRSCSLIHSEMGCVTKQQT